MSKAHVVWGAGPKNCKLRERRWTRCCVCLLWHASNWPSAGNRDRNWISHGTTQAARVLRACVCAAWVTPLPVWGPSTSMHRLFQKQHLHTHAHSTCSPSLVVTRELCDVARANPDTHHPATRGKAGTSRSNAVSSNGTVHPRRQPHDSPPRIPPLRTRLSGVHAITQAHGFKTSPADTTCKACLWAALALSRGSGQRDGRVVDSGFLHRQGRDAPVRRRLAWGGSLHTARRPRVGKRKPTSFLKSSKFF
jgi:hypothetical protein